MEKQDCLNKIKEMINEDDGLIPKAVKNLENF